jgi:transcriptional regulator with PAS, ATPase and Fis domain
VIDIVRELSFETGHEFLAKLGIPNEKVIERAKLLQNEYKVDAIIACGILRETIANHVDVPIIKADYTNLQLAIAFHKAYALSDKVVFVEFKRSVKTYDLDMVKSSFDYDIDVISMKGIEELDETVQTIFDKGYEVVVTAANCVLGKVTPKLRGIEIKPGKAELLAAIDLAEQTIELVNKKADKICWMQTIVDTIQEGILVCDEAGVIEIFNEAAEEATGIPVKSVLGRNVRHLLKNSSISCLYGDGHSITNDIVFLDTGKLIVNRIPIYLGSKQRGLVVKMQKVTKIQDLEHKIRKELLNKGFVAKTTFDDIEGNSALMQGLKAVAKKYAASVSTIIINGESGTGKELFAQSIHNSSPCGKGPFVAVNCAALSESLLESELFGYEEGAFTGAKKGGKPGLFELAHGGTIFLDEIGDMPRSLQSRLLRVIQEKEVLRLGGSRVIPVNNRIICATNKDLAREAEAGSFRQDLYYRINILQLKIPPFRERPEDIPVLAMAFIHKKCKEARRDVSIKAEYLDVLQEYSWPGNAREIEAFVERLLSAVEGSVVDYNDVALCFSQIRGTARTPVLPAGQPSSLPLAAGKMLVNLGTIDEMETEIIEQVMSYVNGDREKAEKLLGISKTTIWRKMKRISHVSGNLASFPADVQ